MALTVGALACAMSGCLVVAAGAAAGGTILYVKGELQGRLAAPVDRAAIATEKAMADLGLQADAASKDGLTAQYVAHLADTTRVVIQLEGSGDETTRVGIRVGLVGDRDMSQRILTAIRDNL
jgi:hypothetical protein